MGKNGRIRLWKWQGYGKLGSCHNNHLDEIKNLEFMLIMKRKMKTICWIVFTAGSMVCLFYNFMSRPPVNDPKALTIYMICAAGAAIIYPAIMLFLAFRNRSLRERLQKADRNLTEFIREIQLYCWSGSSQAHQCTQRWRAYFWWGERASVGIH